MAQHNCLRQIWIASAWCFLYGVLDVAADRIHADAVRTCMYLLFLLLLALHLKSRRKNDIGILGRRIHISDFIPGVPLLIFPLFCAARTGFGSAAEPIRIAAMVNLLCAAFFEEVFFRKTLAELLIPRMGRMPSIAITAAAFGLAHALLPDIAVSDRIIRCLYAASTGVIFSLLTLRSGYIFPAFGIHAAINILVECFPAEIKSRELIAAAALQMIYGLFLYRYCRKKGRFVI